MDEPYSWIHSSISYPISGDFPGDASGGSINISAGLSDHHHRQLVAGAEAHEVATGLEMSDIIKAQIANHPLYPNLLSAYIECEKVGAPPEIASLLEEISKETHLISISSDNGTDPELDDFMKSYCEVLLKYKEELSKPVDEATHFLTSIESRLSDLCKESLPSAATYSYHSADDIAGGPTDRDLKEMLMCKHSGHLCSLRKGLLKKRKAGKLPEDATTALLDWWNAHYRWPYPTEEEKSRLSEMTGLDQKQVNNWFINKRKRQWRPSEDMKSALMEGVSGGGIDAGSMYLYAAGDHHNS